MHWCGTILPIFKYYRYGIDIKYKYKGLHAINNFMYEYVSQMLLSRKCNVGEYSV